MTVASVFRYLGLDTGRRRPTERDLIEKVREGLPLDKVRAFLDDWHFTREELHRNLHVSRSTWSRKGRNQRLNQAQSEKIMRLVEVLALAVDVLEAEEAALRWLRDPNRALGNECPMALLDTDTGTRWVEAVLLRIEHGIYS